MFLFKLYFFLKEMDPYVNDTFFQPNALRISNKYLY